MPGVLLGFCFSPQKVLFFFFVLRFPPAFLQSRNKISLSCVIVYVSITVKMAKAGPVHPPMATPCQNWLIELPLYEICESSEMCVEIRVLVFVLAFAISLPLPLPLPLPHGRGGSSPWVGGWLGLGGLYSSPARVAPADLCLCALWLTICSIKYIKLCAALRRPLNLIDLWQTAAEAVSKNQKRRVRVRVRGWCDGGSGLLGPNPRKDIAD